MPHSTNSTTAFPLFWLFYQWGMKKISKDYHWCSLNAGYTGNNMEKITTSCFAHSNLLDSFAFHTGSSRCKDTLQRRCCYGYTIHPWWKVVSTTQDHIVWHPGENAEKIAMLQRWFDVICCNNFITFSVILIVMSGMQVPGERGNYTGQNTPSRLVVRLHLFRGKSLKSCM